MKKYEADLIHVRGWNDRMAGKPITANPYLLTSVKNHGLQKQSWWKSGWTAADGTLQTQSRP